MKNSPCCRERCRRRCKPTSCAGAHGCFRSVVQELACLKHVTTTEASVRRHTEAAGEAYVAWQTDQVEHVERTTPPPPPGAARQLLSADGALVPLHHGEWAEVKTAAIGDIQPPVLEKGAPVVHTTHLSYFSRLAEHAPFNRLAVLSEAEGSKPIGAARNAPRVCVR